MKRRSGTTIAVFWSMVCLGLAGIIAFQTFGDTPLRPVEAAAIGTPEERDRERRDLLQLRPVLKQIPSMIIDRPLFFETRRPFMPEPEKKSVTIKKRTVKKKPSFELAGTISRGKRRAALLILVDGFGC